MKFRHCLVAFAVFAVSPANAAVVINMQEVGADVVVTTSGTLDLSGATLLGASDPSNASVSPSAAFFRTTGQVLNAYRGLSGPTSFGTGTVTFGAGTGDAFFINGSGGIFGGALGYISGAALNATSTFAGSSFDSLGLTTGTYLFTVPSDSITVNIGPTSAPVPEPATWALMLIGFGAIGATMRSKRQSQTRISFAF